MQRIFLFLCLFAAAGFAPPGSRDPAPAISFEKETIHVGRLFDGENVERVFRFVNRGDAVLKITSVSASCGCTSTMLSANEIAPGGEGRIQVRVLTANLAAQSRTTTEEVRLDKTITVSSNDPKHPQVILKIAGTVVPEIALSEPSLYFGTIRPGQDVTREIRIEIARDRDVELLGATSTDDAVSVRLEEVPGSGGKKSRLVVVMKALAGEGLHSGRIVVRTTSGLKPELRIEVRGIFTKGG